MQQAEKFQVPQKIVRNETLFNNLPTEWAMRIILWRIDIWIMHTAYLSSVAHTIYDHNI